MTSSRAASPLALRLSIALALAGLSAGFAACSGGDDSAANDADAGDAATGSDADGLDGSPLDSGLDSAPTGDGAFVPATHPAAPTLVNKGGPLLAAPRIVPVYYASDPAASTIDTFAAGIGSSSYWHDALSEYGVGAATHAPSVVLSESPPSTITDTEIEQWLATQLASPDAGLDAGPDAGIGAADEGAVYTLFYPESTTITFGGGGTACTDVFAYHSEITVGSKHIVYAVIPRCPGGDAGTAIEEMTYAASHEIAEAATDPRVLSALAYGAMDNDHAVWSMFPGPENGDLCAVFDDFSLKPSDIGGLTVQRLWSNAAAAGHDPCVPAVSGPYFNAVPVLNESLPTPLATSGNTLGVKVPVGQTKTVDVVLFSDADTGGPWQVAVSDLATTFQFPAELEVSLDKTSGKNGDVLHLSIKRLQDGAVGGSSFELVSSMSGRRHTWYGFAGN